MVDKTKAAVLNSRINLGGIVKQVRIVLIVLFFSGCSLLLSSRREGSSTQAGQSESVHWGCFGCDGWMCDLPETRPYFTGQFPGDTRPMKVGIDYRFPINDFSFSDSATSLRLPDYGDHFEPEYSKEVDDLVDDYFDGRISYDELEGRLDDLGWGLDPFWGPYPFSKSRLRLMGCDGFYYSGYGSYGYRPYPETDGIQFDQFRLINPQIQLSD